VGECLYYVNYGLAHLPPDYQHRRLEQPEGQRHSQHLAARHLPHRDAARHGHGEAVQGQADRDEENREQVHGIRV